MEAIVVALLPLITSLGTAWINYYFTDQQEKTEALSVFNQFIALHKNDGVNSASSHDSYQDQVTDLGSQEEKKS